MSKNFGPALLVAALITGCGSGLSASDRDFLSKFQAPAHALQAVTIPLVVQTFQTGARDLRAGTAPGARKLAAHTLADQASTQIVALQSLKRDFDQLAPSSALRELQLAESALTDRLSDELVAFRTLATDCAAPDPAAVDGLEETLARLNEAGKQRAQAVKAAQEDYDRVSQTYPEIRHSLDRIPNIGPFH